MILQPSLSLGYEFEFTESLRLSLAIANGFEINMFTFGEEVAQGFVTLGQFRIIRRFQ
jgi:hypothetical protein